jgi:hypothetical protein
MDKAKNTPLDWSEDKLQMVSYVWFNNTYPEYRGLLFHVANGGSRNKVEAAKLEKMGVYPGVADLLCFIGEPSALELKRPDGRGSQSPAQKKWQEKWESSGREYVIFNDLEDIQDYLKKKVDRYK